MTTLLAMGADPDMPNERGWTVLHQAAYRNDPPMVALLLDAGADHRLEAHGAGGTPLAQRRASWDMSKALTQRRSTGKLPVFSR